MHPGSSFFNELKEVLIMKHRRLRTIISIFSLWILLIAGIAGCSDLESGTTAQRTAAQNDASGGEDVLNVYFLDIGQGDCIAII